MNRDDINYGYVIEEIIKELAIDTELPVSLVIDLVSKELEISVNEIKNKLLKINSKFTRSNSIIGYINGKPLLRTTSYCAIHSLFNKIKKKFNIRDMNDKELNLMYNTIVDYSEELIFKNVKNI
jgi:hypothetical protein